MNERFIGFNMPLYLLVISSFFFYNKAETKNKFLFPAIKFVVGMKTINEEFKKYCHKGLSSFKVLKRYFVEN